MSTTLPHNIFHNFLMLEVGSWAGPEDTLSDYDLHLCRAL
jgi:hypothetical protein